MSVVPTFSAQMSVIDRFVGSDPHAGRWIVHGCAKCVGGTDMGPGAAHGCAKCVGGTDMGPGAAPENQDQAALVAVRWPAARIDRSATPGAPEDAAAPNNARASRARTSN